MNTKALIKDDISRLTAVGSLPFFAAAAKKLLFNRLKSIEYGQITIQDDSGSYTFGAFEPDGLHVKLHVNNSGFYENIVLDGSIGAGESYMLGYWECDDIVSLIRLFIQNRHVLDRMNGGLARLTEPFNRMYHFLRNNSISGSKKNIAAHYDLSNEFYALFLDPTMTYSCGFFESETSTLEDASIAKIDRLCRKLNLQPGDHVLEIGTGWGGFALHAAQKYGCRVTTTTISDEQYEYARELIIREKMDNRVTVLNADYRRLDGTYDKIVSIEMIEAVGANHIREYFETCNRLLKPGGTMAFQGITIPDQRFDGYRKSVDFIQRYIFPGSCLISVSHILDTLKNSTDFKIVHLEEIGIHYAQTLRIWRRNFLNRLADVRKLGFSGQFIRMWEYYLAYCEGGFAERYIGNVQIVLARPSEKNEYVPGKLPGGEIV